MFYAFLKSACGLVFTLEVIYLLFVALTGRALDAVIDSPRQVVVSSGEVIMIEDWPVFNMSRSEGPVSRKGEGQRVGESKR